MMISEVLGILIFISILIGVACAALNEFDHRTGIDWGLIAAVIIAVNIAFLAGAIYVGATKTTVEDVNYNVKKIAADYGLEPEVCTTHYDDTDIRAQLIEDGFKDRIEIEHLFGIKTMKYVVYKNEPPVDNFASYKRDISSNE